MDETHPLSLGWVGMHGWKHVNRAIQSADLLIALGMRFDDRVTGHVPTFAPYARIIHVDIDPAEIGKNVAVEIPIVGDVKRVLTALLPLVPAVEPESRAAYLTELAEWRVESEKTPWHGLGLAQRPALGRLRGLQDRRGHQPRRHDRRRRRPEPDVGRPIRRVPPAEQPHQLGRSGHDGLRTACRDGRRDGPARQGDLGNRWRWRPADDGARA